MSSFRLRLLVVGLVGFLLPAGALAERTVLIEDYDPAFSYVGDGWRSYGPLAIFSGYRAHQACEKQPLGSEVANTATVTFTGKSAALVTMVAPGCGKVTWDLDGGAQTGEIDLKADTPKAQVRVPVVDGLADSEHRLALTPVGPPAKTGGDTAVSALPVNSSVWIDGLEVVTDSPPPAPTPPAAPAVKVTIDLQPKDGLVQLGETATITYRVSVLAPPQDVKIAYQVYDIDANPIASGEDEANIKPGDPVETERQITVQPPRYGHYQIRVKVTDKESGKVLAEERSGIVAMMERNLARDEGSQFGVELHPGDEDALATMAKLGLAHARVSVDWAAHEPSKGNYVYPLDKIIDAANDAELTVMAVIDGKPDWAQGTPEEFAAFARALAAHYGAKVQGYVLLEAVNTGLNPLAPTPAAYVALASPAAREIRAAAPEAKVAIGGFIHAPGQQDWTDNCVEILQTMPLGLVDAIAVLGMGWGSPMVEEYTGRITAINAGKANYGRLPMWFTRTGAATAPAGAWNGYAWTEPMQARELVKCALMSFSGRATLVYMGDLVDRGGDAKLGGAGLLNTRHQPKVAAGMIATMTNLINGARFPIYQRTGPDTYVVMCQHGMTPTLAFWTSAAEANGKAFAKIGWRAYAEEVRILDSMGNAHSEKTQDEMIDFLATETPGYVLGCGEDMALPIPPDMR